MFLLKIKKSKFFKKKGAILQRRGLVRRGSLVGLRFFRPYEVPVIEEIRLAAFELCLATAVNASFNVGVDPTLVVLNYYGRVL